MRYDYWLKHTPITMITEERAFYILQLEESATADEIVARYEILKDQYRKIKDETEDLRTRLAYQLKQIELDDVFIYFRRKQRI
ncbi:hypothetical protein CLV51_101306 [Chitinophaga niastensis]|uniref:Uncharacterized protein n=2 Tax=Chitinophaga niastensis TaxID=536980 RepID=A0A2P8HRX0_CHINA|nr:hypothetical protein CLV51_101306 [Chitinophaga niastensis]